MPVPPLPCRPPRHPVVDFRAGRLNTRKKAMGSFSRLKAGLFTALVAGSLIASAQVPVQVPQQPAQAPAAAPAGPPPRAPMDPRVQQRSYKFEGTNEDIPYAVFVSSKVSKDKKN